MFIPTLIKYSLNDSAISLSSEITVSSIIASWPRENCEKDCERANFLVQAIPRTEQTDGLDASLLKLALIYIYV